MLLEQILGHNIFQDLDLEEPLQIWKEKVYDNLWNQFYQNNFNQPKNDWL